MRHSTFMNRLWSHLFPSKPDYRIFRGYFDLVQYANSELTVAGWVVSEQGPYDGLILSINGTQWETYEIVQRSDVAGGLPYIPQSINAGFRFQIKVLPEELQGMVDIRVSCIQHQKEVDVMETGFFLDMYEEIPTPPLKLLKRVDGSESGDFYLLKGAQNYRELWRLIQRHTDLTTINTLLDWGCGSGRLTGFFLHYSSFKEIHGCDIDPDAIQWAQQHFPKGIFTTIPLYPPTGYRSQQFDVIVSFSVLTHLDRNTQLDWLQEMNRLLAPGGVFIATLHGPTAARVALGKEYADIVLREGIYDSVHDTSLDEVVSDAYYRACFQSRTYIEKHWSPIFEIVEFIEKGASHYHDIAVMKKRKSLSS